MQKSKNSSMAAPAIVIREVWQSNLTAEMILIQKHLEDFPYISLDAEFPGTVFYDASDDLYAAMKRNVDALCLIQLGLTLSDAAGNLPCWGGARHAWEFNFSGFDPASDLQNPASVSLLKRQGIDFAKNKLMGVNPRDFAVQFKIAGLGLRAIRRRDLTWVTFHGLNDFGYLVKILTGRRLLPERVDHFMMLLRLFLGPNVYDLKPVAREVGLYGGLEKIAKRLMVDRAAGRSHQAGSDSLLTMQVFAALVKKLGGGAKKIRIEDFNYKLYGLTTS